MGLSDAGAPEEAEPAVIEGNGAERADDAQPKVTPETALQLIDAACQPEDFTLQYDQAVDLLENIHLEQALGALREGKGEDALPHLADIKLLRNGYMQLLQSSEADQNHELRSELENLRKFAQSQQALTGWLTQLAQAMKAFREGEWNEALRTLDRGDSATVLQPADPELLSIMSSFAAGIGEMLGGEIRAAVQDYGGARAAYDRSAAIFRHLEEEEERDGDGTETKPPSFPRLYGEASSLKAQLAQLLQANDYETGGKVAEAAAAGFAEAADRMSSEDPDSEHLLVPLIHGIAAEHLAKAEECAAELALEREDWDAALDHSKRASNHYGVASKKCLESTMAVARVNQERLLNASFNWGVQFRRRAEREQGAARRYRELHEELEKLRNSVRDALQPAGVTLNSNTEIANEVHQQVEAVTRVELNVRNLLREVPEALQEAELPTEQKRELQEEAMVLAESSESGPDFREKVKNFCSKLSAAADKAGTTAGGIAALLKALGVLG